MALIISVDSSINFYPRPPRGGRLLIITPQGCKGRISIHALREEGDVPWAKPTSTSSYFYPRPPRGGRRGGVQPDRRPRRISIHALREEGDCVGNHDTYTKDIFLATPSARRATRACNAAASGWSHFYPRPPRGGRRTTSTTGPLGTGLFLSTPSARRATPRRKAHYPGFLISIHALREEGDPSSRDRLEV